jgi:hypothetical protein
MPARAALVLGHRGNREKEMQRKFDFYRGIFHFSKSGPVQTGRPPPVEGGGWESESFRLFNKRQESDNGTRELRTGSRSVHFNMGPQSVTGSRLAWR